MIGNRVIFAFIFMFFSLIMIISTAPILNNQLVTMKLAEISTNPTITTTESVTYEDNSSDSNEKDIQSTTTEHEEEEITVKHQQVLPIEHEKEITTVKQQQQVLPVEHEEEVTTVEHQEEDTTVKHEVVIPIKYQVVAPVKRQELTTVKYAEGTTTIPTVVTDDLLFADTTDLIIDINDIIRVDDRVVAENQMEIPSTLTTESLELIQTSTTDKN